ncbi:DUF559 domain-containing protein, partial [bacterium]|nr:DUF559 domain-containing protein [bacterium]
MHADRTNNYGYNARLRPYANMLRKKMTKAEACLWKYAQHARQIKGYQFLRQRPVLQFIADFLCRELILIFEVDGLHHHLLDASVTADRLKDRELIRAGFRV